MVTSWTLAERWRLLWHLHRTYDLLLVMQCSRPRWRLLHSPYVDWDGAMNFKESLLHIGVLLRFESPVLHVITDYDMPLSGDENSESSLYRGLLRRKSNWFCQREFDYLQSNVDQWNKHVMSSLPLSSPTVTKMMMSCSDCLVDPALLVCPLPLLGSGHTNNIGWRRVAIGVCEGWVCLPGRLAR